MLTDCNFFDTINSSKTKQHTNLSKGGTDHRKRNVTPQKILL